MGGVPFEHARTDSCLRGGSGEVEGEEMKRGKRTFNIQHSTFNIETHSLDVECSMLNVLCRNHPDSARVSRTLALTPALSPEEREISERRWRSFPSQLQLSSKYSNSPDARTVTLSLGERAGVRASVSTNFSQSR